MPRFTKEEIQTRFQKLPPNLKDAIVDVDVSEKIFAIGESTGLTIEQIGTLAAETGYVTLGLTRPNEFVSALSKNLGISEDAAKKIAAEVNHQIFYPIREALKSAHQVEITYEKIESGKEQVVSSKDERIETKAPVPKMPLPKDVVPMSALKGEKQDTNSKEQVVRSKDESIETTAAIPKSAMEPKAPELPEIMGGIFFAGPAGDEKQEERSKKQGNESTTPEAPKLPAREVKPPIDLRKVEPPSLTPPTPQPPLPTLTPEPKKSPYDSTDPYREAVD